MNTEAEIQNLNVKIDKMMILFEKIMENEKLKMENEKLKTENEILKLQIEKMSLIAENQKLNSMHNNLVESTEKQKVNNDQTFGGSRVVSSFQYPVWGFGGRLTGPLEGLSTSSTRVRSKKQKTDTEKDDSV